MTALLLQFAPHDVRRSKKRAEAYLNTHANLIGFVEACRRRRDDDVIAAGMVELGDADEMRALFGLGSFGGEAS